MIDGLDILISVFEGKFLTKVDRVL